MCVGSTTVASRSAPCGSTPPLQSNPGPSGMTAPFRKHPPPASNPRTDTHPRADRAPPAMPWPSGRRAGAPNRNSPQWRRARAAALKRDRHRCQAPTPTGEPCHQPATEVDHLQRGDDHRLANLQSLCGAHHASKSAREGHDARRDQLQRTVRPSETHPFHNWISGGG